MGRLIDATTFADLEARRFTLRVSATRRDTKASRKDTKMQQGSELPGLGQGASSVKSERESLDGHARIRAEIDQQPKLALRHSQIVENLPTVFVGQSAHRLELQDYLSKAKDVRYVLFLDLLALVEDRQFFLGLSCIFVWFREIFVSHHVAETRRVKRCDCGRRRSARQ